jgi:DNA-damage-inducible protein D
MTKPIKVDPKSHISPFEQIRHLDPVTGEEYWSSREFAVVLGYADYDWFKKVIEKAEQACFNSGHEIEDHFRGSSEMVALGSGAKRSVKTVHMSRYACYLAIQNADPQKEIVALGQTYFAVQTRRQEVADQQLLEGDRRVLLRAELRNHNSKLADAAKAAGVVEPIDYAIFQNHGYKGLYNGLDQAAIHRRKGLKKSQKILDHMGSTELAANLFRATQTEEKLKRDKVQGKAAANATHFAVGAKVRQTMKELGNPMPEDLPTPSESIQQLEARRAKRLKQEEEPGKLEE